MTLSSPMAPASNDVGKDQVQWVIFQPKSSKQLPIDTAFTHLTFGPSMRVIPKSAFADHPVLQSVKIPKTIKKIRREAFRNCENLSAVEFQDDGSLLRTICERAFQNCYLLKKDLRIPDTVRVIGLGAFQDCGALSRVQLPSGLKVVRESTFRGCSTLREIELPDGLCRIEAYSFSGCQSLERIKIPRHTVKVIGKGAFGGCRSLTSVELPNGLRKIRKKTFVGCELLSGVVLPSSLELIENRAFLNCYSLLGVEFAKDSHAKVNPFAFLRCSSLMNVCIPGTVVAAKSTSIVSRFMSCRSSSSVCDEPSPFRHNYQLRGKDGHHHHIQERFAELPIHSLCYHASVTTVAQLKQALNACNGLESTEWKDYLGMTPFHIVATSANPRVDLLECLLSKYCPDHMLSQKDNRGDTMMDYLLQNTRGSEMLQLVLRHVFAEFLWVRDKTAQLPKQEQHKGEIPRGLSTKELNSQIESLAECIDTTSKREQVIEIFESVGFHLQKEKTTLLELAAWKKRIVEVRHETHPPTTEGFDRETCRYQCGAEVLIENVTDYYLIPPEDEESKYLPTALAAFPLCTLNRNLLDIISRDDPYIGHFFG